MLDLLCVGDVMLDVRVAAGMLARGGDVHGRVRLRPGGTSANAAAWAAWTGARAGVVAAVGDDATGRLCEDALRERGVDVRGIVRHEAETGVMLVVTEEGERSMVADRGANATLEGSDLPSLEAGAVLVSGYLFLQEPGHDVAVRAMERSRTPILAIDAASWPLIEAFGAHRFLSGTADCDAIFANGPEAMALTGRRGLEAARVLGERYRIAAVKLGPEGAAAVVDGVALLEPARPIDERDPTGAGDAFDGVLLSSLVRGVSPEEALAGACRAGERVAEAPETWPEASPRDRS